MRKLIVLFALLCTLPMFGDNRQRSHAEQSGVARQQDAADFIASDELFSRLSVDEPSAPIDGPVAEPPLTLPIDGPVQQRGSHKQIVAEVQGCRWCQGVERREMKCYNTTTGATGSGTQCGTGSNFNIYSNEIVETGTQCRLLSGSYNMATLLDNGGKGMSTSMMDWWFSVLNSGPYGLNPDGTNNPYVTTVSAETSQNCGQNYYYTTGSTGYGGVTYQVKNWYCWLTGSMCPEGGSTVIVDPGD